jgi:alanine racemase
MHRSEITIDLGAVRRNTRTLLRELDGSDLWAVVKANGYGHGAVDVAAAALGSGARAVCVATVAEALELRHEFPAEKIVVLGPPEGRDVALAREAGLELVVATDEIPEGVRVHLKLDTGMGRYGLAELPQPPVEVVGLMTHLATADSDPAFAREQIARFRSATDSHSHLTRHVANSAAVLRIPESRFDAARCGIALYGLSPFGESAEADGLEPVLHWQSHLAQVKLLRPGESTGYGRRFIAEQPTWIGIVPVGYGDGFQRALSGTTVRVAGQPALVVGSVSMDSFTVELERELPLGTPVVIVGHGLSLDQHARHAGTISYELSTGIETRPARARRLVVDS